MTSGPAGIWARFHLAFPVVDLEATRAFYHGLLGCRLGRESDRWIDFDLHGHQITAHLVDASAGAATNPVDGDAVPVPHFGLILGWDDWQGLARRLEEYRVDFVIAPKIRFRGEIGEQATMFLTDPSGNALEFKAFRDEGDIFATPQGDES